VNLERPSNTNSCDHSKETKENEENEGILDRKVIRVRWERRVLKVRKVSLVLVEKTDCQDPSETPTPFIV
jgi:hypothetical protein